jgi:hypothetical protein
MGRIPTWPHYAINTVVTKRGNGKHGPIQETVHTKKRRTEGDECLRLGPANKQYRLCPENADALRQMAEVFMSR